MATLFRAVVMLIVLVGLPATWVYYGPLPPGAMGVIQRTVATAKDSLGWQDLAPNNTWHHETSRTAARFDSSLAEATHELQQQATVLQAAKPLKPMTRDAQFALVSATVPVPPLQVDTELARQLEPHLSLLRSLDAAEYTLENWGGGGQLYRFRCAIALGKNGDHTRQFEAVDAVAQHAVQQVVGEVTAWQNARQIGTTSRWK